MVVFVGRGAEVGVLRELVAAVAGGRGGVAWVEGEPGIGKSALVREGLSGAADAGCLGLWGMADELRGRFPLGVIVDCLMAARAAVGGELEGVSLLLRGEGAGDVIAVAAERVLAAVDRLCAASPVVLVLDDVQWADEVSVSVWHRLAAATAQVPLLVVAIARPVPWSAPLVVARRGAAERGVMLPVRPLPDAEVAVLVGELAGGRAGPGLAGLARQAGGNPLYVRELTEALVREGRVRVTKGVAELAVDAGSGAPVTLAAAIEGRLGFVSPEALVVLRMAALLGAQFSVRDLAVVSGRGGWDLAGLVREAVSAGVLVESGEQLAFRHGLIARALVDGMPTGVRAELHRDAARALAAADAGAERVAAQLAAAGPRLEEWALDWLTQRGQELADRAPRVAAELLDRAAGQVARADRWARGGLTGAPGRDDVRWEVLAELLARVLLVLARNERAEAVAGEVLEATADARRRTRVAWTLASALRESGRRSQALEVISQVLPGADPADPWTARLHAARALTLVVDVRSANAGSEQIFRAAAAAAEALMAAQRAGDRLAAGYALHVQATLSYRRGEEAGALRLSEQALDVIGDDPEATDLRLLLLSNRMGSRFGSDEDVSAEASELIALAERAGTARLAMVRTAVAEMLFYQGRWDDALAELDAVLDPAADIQSVVRMTAIGVAALIAAHRDDQPSLSAWLRAAEELEPNVTEGKSPFGSFLSRASAMAAERDGRPADAVAILTADRPAGARIDLDEAQAMLELVGYALTAGDEQAARDAAARCEQVAAELADVKEAVALSRQCRGVTDSDPGLIAEAVAHFRGRPRPPDLAKALEDLAVAQAGRGELVAARACLNEAVGIFAGMGAEWDMLRADTRLRPFGVRRRRAGTPRPRTGWQALTPTEAKIAALVGAGLSNPEIGSRMFLSRYTVQVHVSHILAKLQARSRVEIAGQVASQPAEFNQPAERSTA